MPTTATYYKRYTGDRCPVCNEPSLQWEYCQMDPYGWYEARCYNLRCQFTYTPTWGIPYDIAALQAIQERADDDMQLPQAC